MSKAITELALIIKGSGNPPRQQHSSANFKGFFVGTVEVAPPELQVRLSPEIVLFKENLVISAAVLKDYEREFEIFDAEIQFTDSDCGQTTNVSAHTHEIASLNINSQTLKAKGKIKWTDELVEGDMVILVPAQNENMYILIEKAVEL